MAKFDKRKRSRTSATHFRPIRHRHITNYGSGACLNDPGAQDERLYIWGKPVFEVFR